MLFLRTDERRYERVVFFASQPGDGVQVIDVAVGIGDQILGPHLQLDLNALPQYSLLFKILNLIQIIYLFNLI